MPYDTIVCIIYIVEVFWKWQRWQVVSMTQQSLSGLYLDLDLNWRMRCDIHYGNFISTPWFYVFQSAVKLFFGMKLFLNRLLWRQYTPVGWRFFNTFSLIIFSFYVPKWEGGKNAEKDYLKPNLE